MVSDGVKIQRPLELHIEAARMFEGFSLSMPVGIIGCSNSAKCKRIKGIGSMGMQVTKESLAGSIGTCISDKPVSGYGYLATTES